MRIAKSFIVALAALAIVCGFLTFVPRLQGANKLEVLYEFHGKDGQSPSAGVTFDSTGNLYGTTT
ncbi:MAG TPA: hypothetical protein VNZ03_25455 [Terriglobales bacterium]|nr:hypothetical protein [Terriglobales bacterium]